METIVKEKVLPITPSMVDKWDRTSSLVLTHTHEIDQIKAKIADLARNEWSQKLFSHIRGVSLDSFSVVIPQNIRENFKKIEEDFSIYSNRILWCNELKHCLSKFEEELEEYEVKYLSWFVSTLKDVFSYNYAEQISEEQLTLIKKGIDMIYEKQEDCDKDSYMEYHMLLIESGLSLLPTSKKAINEFGE